MKYIKNPCDFLVNTGLLYEVNRRILHPLGLALAVELPEHTTEQESGTFRIWDAQDDPEGLLFGESGLAVDEAKLAITLTEAKPRLDSRQKATGYVLQNVDSTRLAIQAYSAYTAVHKQTQPLWEELSEEARQAWRAAALTVTEAHLRYHT